MKKSALLMTMSLGVLVLAGCNCNCNVNVNDNCATPNESKQFCLDNGGTYYDVTSIDEIYGECYFPSGIGCRDDILGTEECNFIPDTSNIDTEEERLAGCEDSVIGWVEDFEEGENITINWEAEEEAGASFVRNGVVHYTKQGDNWQIAVECVADFVDGSISTSYGNTLLDE